MTVTHSKSLSTLRKRQKRRKTTARLAKEAEKASKQGVATSAVSKPQDSSKEKGAA